MEQQANDATQGGNGSGPRTPVTVPAPLPKKESEFVKVRNEIEAVVEQWYAKHLHNTVVTADTAIHNKISSVKVHLVDDLEALFNRKEKGQ